MIVPSDKDYRETKRIKRGEIILTSPLREMADWIATTYEVRVLNLYYDTIDPDNRPRLDVILESWEDARKFRSGEYGCYDEARQKEIKTQFTALLSRQPDRHFRTEKLLVIFSAFEPIAREEANGRVTTFEIARLKTKLANPDLWKIRNRFGGATFFFHTNAQAKAAEARGLKDLYTAEYARVVEPYDEFGYFKQCPPIVAFDSKENFDTRFAGNWFYYDR